MSARRSRGAEGFIDASGLELFARIVEAGNLARAAQRLGQTRAAVSRRLASVEARLGQPLLIRTTRSMTLTDAGRRLLASAIAVRDASDQARSATRTAQTARTTRLRIATLPSFAHAVLLPLVARFSAARPGVRFDLLVSDRRIDLAKHGVDVAFRITSKPPPDCVARSAWPFQIRAYARPGAFRASDDPASLGPSAMLLLGAAAAAAPRWERVDGRPSRVEMIADGATYSDDLVSLVRLAELGAGVVVAPDYLVRDAVERGTLTDVLPDWRLRIPQGDQVLMLTAPSRQLRPVVRDWIRFVLADGTAFPTVSRPRTLVV